MSIKRLSCPGCGTTMNVPASMAKAQCPSCGQVFLTNQPSSANAPTPARGPSEKQPTGRKPGSESKMMQWVAVLGVSFIAMAILIGMTFLRVTDAQEEAAKADQIAAEQQAQAEIEAKKNLEYRVVDLPESTRQQIYRDYSAMTNSMNRNSKKIPKSGAAGKAFNSLMQKTADREATHFALMHNITEEDVMQIVIEGQAKDW
ncbi:zinc-ribbon domain-containing protein [Stieleria sp. JC731]|uniref:zinc-ribbon domain-containing protein n=1 Tax=Pirellulaceae TaxID=2691357 RepID=UPI001E63978B|nr:zinc-ribbon domain-containing protein [Stieleria sp. JC731]MCC9601174.1 zinc-ribbon domain-containing protein [Stieleria sp. JC731]